MNTHSAVPVNRISSDETPRNISRAGNGDAFEQNLRAEEEKIRQMEKSFCLAALPSMQNLLGSLPLQFDFNFSAAAAGNNLLRHQDSEAAFFDGKDNVSGSSLSPDHADPKTGSPEPSSPARMVFEIDQNIFIKNLLSSNPYAFSEFTLPASLAGFGRPALSSSDLQLVVSEIMDKVSLIREGEKATLSIALRSGDSSRMLLDLSIKNGLVSISIAADGETVDWIERHLAELEESLKQANINLGSLDVSSGGGKKRAAEPVEEVPLVAAVAEPEKSGKIEELFDILGLHAVKSKA